MTEQGGGKKTPEDIIRTLISDGNALSNATPEQKEEWTRALLQDHGVSGEDDLLGKMAELEKETKDNPGPDGKKSTGPFE